MRLFTKFNRAMADGHQPTLWAATALIVGAVVAYDLDRKKKAKVAAAAKEFERRRQMERLQQEDDQAKPAER